MRGVFLLCFHFRSTGSRTGRCFLVQRQHLSQNPMHTCKQSGFDEEGLWGLCTVNNLYGFIASLLVHDWAASALECHQHIANLIQQTSCHVEHIWVWQVIAPKLNPLHKHIAYTIAQFPSIILLCYICKHSWRPDSKHFVSEKLQEFGVYWNPALFRCIQSGLQSHLHISH